MAFDDQRRLVPAAVDGFPHLGRPQTGPRTSDLMPRGEFSFATEWEAKRVDLVEDLERSGAVRNRLR